MEARRWRGKSGPQGDGGVVTMTLRDASGATIKTVPAVDHGDQLAARARGAMQSSRRHCARAGTRRQTVRSAVIANRSRGEQEVLITSAGRGKTRAPVVRRPDRGPSRRTVRVAWTLLTS